MSAPIRCITLHLPEPESWSSASLELYVDGWLHRLLEVHDVVSGEYGVGASTLRITLPDPPLDVVVDVPQALDALLGSSEDVLVSIGGVPYKEDLLLELVPEASRLGFYHYIKLGEASWGKARFLARLIGRVSEEDPEAATRFGVSLNGDGLVTPYYPLSWSPGGEPLVSVALTYPQLLLESYRSRGLRGVEEAVESSGSRALAFAGAVAGRLGARLAGVDLSISPWMENSTLALIEAVAGVRLAEPGIALGIRVLNDILSRVAGRLESTGFNLVQLPVAEDSKLKLRIASLDVKARDLARLSGACLAGLDLVVVPYDEVGVAGLVLETAAYSRPGKILGVRIVALEGLEPGDKVELGKFGEVPVAPV